MNKEDTINEYKAPIEIILKEEIMFEINGMHWNICQLSQEEIKSTMNKRRNNEEDDIKSVDKRYYGITLFDELAIYIDKDLPLDRKKKTLLHELTHCYIGSYITHQEKQYDEEMVADIFSNSYEIITKIYEKVIIRLGEKK